ncbi:MAG: hypothetical protein P8163_10340 [Candidatus Thiodiazotropha sp.]
MKKDENIPVWVFLAFSSINTRKAALWLVWSCFVFTVYCMPWSALLPGQEWAKVVFIVEDWSWFVMMIPLTAWYWMSLRWVDRNSRWEKSA